MSVHINLPRSVGGKPVPLHLIVAGLTLLGILLVVVPTLPSALSGFGTPIAISAEATPGRVTKVSDGDTIHAALEGDRNEKIRLIGIDTPEFPNEVEPWGREAAAFTAGVAPVGTRVWVETDAELRDRHGRLLAYVWLEKPDGESEDYVRKHMLNAMIAASGFAEPLTVQPNSKYASMFAKFVARARDMELGMWSQNPPGNP